MTFPIYLRIIWGRKLFILSLMTLAILIVAFKTITDEKRYESTASIIINTTGKDPITGATIPTLMQPSFLATQVEIIKSINVASRVVNNLELNKSIDLQNSFAKLGNPNAIFEVWLANALLRNVKVAPSRQSSIIYITYTSNNPLQSAQIANEFAEAFVQTNLDLKIDPSRRTAQWYESQVENIKNELIEARENLSSYQLETGIISINSGYDVESSRISQLNNQLLNLKTTLNALETKQVTFNNFEPSTPNASTISDTMIDRLKVAYVNAQLEFSEVSSKVSENHPDYITALNDKESKRVRLISEIKSAKTKLKAEISETQVLITKVEEAIKEKTTSLLKRNKNRDTLKVLVNKVQNAEVLFNATTQKLNQFKLEGNSLETDVSILNKASPPFSHSNSSLSTNLIIAFIFSGLLALFFVLVIEQLNKRIRDKKTIEDIFGIPVLAEMPKIKI